MTGVSSVGGTSYSQYYVSSSVTAVNGTATSAPATNTSQQKVIKDSSNLNDAIKDLETKLKAFANDGAIDSLFDDDVTSNSFQVMARDSVNKLVKAYNKVNEILKSSKYVTGEGTKLLDSVQNLIGKSSSDYSKLGLDLNKQTGKLKFDDKKFLASLGEDPATTKKLLMNDKYLTTVLKDVTQAVLKKQTDYYFVKPLDVSV